MADERYSSIAVCVATRERPLGLARLLESLTGLDDPGIPVRVVVIDNAEVPSCAAAVESFAPRLHIEWHHEPRPGIPFARNAALDLLADDELMACTDDDCEPHRSWLAALYRVLQERAADAVGGPVSFVRPPGSPAWVHEVGFCSPRAGDGERVQYLSTNNAMFSVRSLRSRRLRFDERYPLLGGEDSWLSNQLARSGGVMVWSADAGVDEHLPASRVSVRWLVRRRFSYGYSASLRRLTDHRVRAWCTEPARVAVRTLGGVAFVVGGVFRGRRAVVRGLLRWAAAAGTVWALVGGRFADYRRTDGS